MKPFDRGAADSPKACDDLRVWIHLGDECLIQARALGFAVVYDDAISVLPTRFETEQKSVPVVDRDLTTATNVELAFFRIGERKLDPRVRPPLLHPRANPSNYPSLDVRLPQCFTTSPNVHPSTCIERPPDVRP